MTNQEIYKLYHELHDVCPSCGSDNIETTCIGFFILYKDGDLIGEDGNRATCCDCKWEGIVHDLVEKE